MDEIKVNLQEIAGILGVSDRTVQRWHGEGLPRHGEGRGTRYPVAGVVAWVRRRDREQFERDLALGPAPDLDEARARKESALARLREMDVAEREGELVSIDDTLKYNERVYGAIRSTLVNAPGKYAPSFVGLSTFAESRVQLEELVREVLTNMIEACERADADFEAEGAA